MLPTTQTAVPAADRLHAATARFMRIDDTTYGNGKDEYAVRFRGRLTVESTQAYAQAAEAYRALGYTPLFRKQDEVHIVLAMPGVLNPPASRPWINLLLFVLTVLSVGLVGAQYETGLLAPTAAGLPAFILAGLPYTASLMGILLAHEFGHYLVARYHKVHVTLPYFLPLPIGILGTLGAFIQIKTPPTNKRAQLDIGIAGPLAGLVLAIPIVIYGLDTSPVQPIPAAFGPNHGIVFEGNSLLYAFLKWLVHGRLLPVPADYGGLPPALYLLRLYVLGYPAPLGGLDVSLNSVAWAGWAGLLVTGLNLIPAGQLDGGHALYGLLGARARRLVPLIVIVLLLLSFRWMGWLLYAALIYFMGRIYLEPLDQITELDPKRKVLALAVLAIFLIIFTPVPLVSVIG